MEVLARLEEERGRFEVVREAAMERERRKKIELYLDRGAGACWLGDPRIADVACGALRFFDRTRYVLDEWVVMPNHVHVIIRPVGEWGLSGILQSWKREIARQGNRVLGKTGETF
jgi:hypothetical protein